MAEKLCLTMGKGGEAKVYIYNHGVESFGGLVTGYNSGVTPTRTKYSNYYYNFLNHYLKINNTLLRHHPLF